VDTDTGGGSGQVFQTRPRRRNRTARPRRACRARAGPPGRAAS